MSSSEDSAVDILPVVAGSEVIASVCVCVLVQVGSRR